MSASASQGRRRKEIDGLAWLPAAQPTAKIASPPIP